VDKDKRQYFLEKNIVDCLVEENLP